MSSGSVRSAAAGRRCQAMMRAPRVVLRSRSRSPALTDRAACSPPTPAQLASTSTAPSSSRRKATAPDPGRPGLLHSPGSRRRRSSRAEEAGRMRRPRAARPNVDRSAFAGFRFPPEVITLAVRWYLRYGLSYRDVEELLAERGRRGRPRHGVPVGAAVHAAVRRGRPPAPARHRGPLVRRRDLRQGRRPVAVPVPGGRPVRPGHRRAAVRAAGHRRPPAGSSPGRCATGRRRSR